jgi:hypothetical protein
MVVDFISNSDPLFVVDGKLRSPNPEFTFNEYFDRNASGLIPTDAVFAPHIKPHGTISFWKLINSGLVRFGGLRLR